MKYLLLTAIALVFSLSAFTQDGPKTDEILKINGEEMIGKVLEIDDASIKFCYTGETLIYVVNKADIVKITFASGRIEFFNKPVETSPANKADHHNKIAILPFKYLIDKQDAGEELTYKVQREAFTLLQGHVGSLEIQDPDATNTLLLKAGVTNSNVRGYTMGEICNILNVEFILQGLVNQESTTTSNVQSTTVDYKNKNFGTTSGKAIGTVNGSAGWVNASTVTSTSQNYQTDITMNVYNDDGNSLFSQNHTSFWSMNDAYKITLQYLLKRIPLYQK